VRLGRQTDAEMDVGLRMLCLPARPDRADDFALGELRPHAHADRPELHERDRVAVGSADRQRQPRARNGAGESDDAGRRRSHLSTCRRADVDPAVLAAHVGVVVGDESLQHGPVDGPAPGCCTRCEHERPHAGREPCEQLLVANLENHDGSRYQGRRLLSNLATEQSGRDGSAAARSAARPRPQPADAARLRRRAPRRPPMPPGRPPARPPRPRRRA
jgi:hypothetical protein